MGPLLSGPIPVFQAITPVTRPDLLRALETQLTAAGWTVVSGLGTATVLFQSGTTPHGLALRLQAKDPGGAANCIQIKLMSPTNLQQSMDFYLRPANLQVWANPYQIFIFMLGAPLDGRTYFSCGIPWLPSNLRAATTQLAWGYGGSSSDTSATYSGNWRNGSLACSAGCQYMSYNGAMWTTQSVSGVSYGLLNLPLPRHAMVSSQSPVQFVDGTYILHAPIASMNIYGPTLMAQVFGYLWDCAVLTDVPVIDSVLVIDGKRFFSLTNAANGDNANLRGTLLLLVP